MDTAERKLNLVEARNSLMAFCTVFREKSTCMKRQTAAALYTDGFVYFGASGDPNGSCKGKGYCEREKTQARNIGKYEVCPSSCAEGLVIMSALEDGADLENSFLATTDFPCGRCTSIIAEHAAPRGLTRLYFYDFKNGARPKDKAHGLWMQDAGVRIYQISNGSSQRLIFPEDAGKVLPVRTPVDFFLQNTPKYPVREVSCDSNWLKDALVGKLPAKVPILSTRSRK